MKLSIVIITHNMRREAARTLYSLSPDHQAGVRADDYEVIVIDNGSSAPLDPESVKQFGPHFRYHYHETHSASPVDAVNLGAHMARGESLAIIVDGARMATPGIVRYTLSALRAEPDALVCALSWHLGPDVQPKSTQEGYDQAFEDAMLKKAGWREDGYQLFAISTLAPSSGTGFFGDFPLECSWVALERNRFHAMGGFDPRFQTAGGGLCNHDFRNRALQQPGIVPVKLLGEGVFHQVHGGIATNAPPAQRPLQAFHDEYTRIHGARFVPVDVVDPVYVGMMPAAARRFIQ